MAEEYEIFHHTSCKHCNADLTLPGSVIVTFSDGNIATNEKESRVTDSGRLVDPTGQVGIGMHSCSECRVCGEMLEELL